MVYRMARPVIGICTTLEKARWSVWELELFAAFVSKLNHCSY